MIILQILVAQKLLLYIGVFRGLFVLPAVAAVSFLWLTFSFTFWPALLMNIMWDLTSNVIQGNAYSLSMNVAPRRIRGRILGVAGGYAVALGQIIAGLILVGIHIGLASFGSSQFKVISILSFLLSLAWLAYVAYGRRFYIQDLVRNIYSESRTTLFDTLESMEERSEPTANQSLMNILHSKEPRFDIEVKAKVMEVLARLGNTASLRVLAIFLKDRQAYLRRAAAKAINNFTGIDSYTFANHYFNGQMQRLFRKDPEGQVRVEAGKYLIHHMPQKALPSYINELLHDPDEFARKAVIESVGKLDVPLVDLMQFELLDDPVPSIRAAAVVQLYAYPDYKERVNGVLTRLLESQDSSEVVDGLIALIKVGGDRKFMPLVEPLSTSQNSKIKSLAALYCLCSGKLDDDKKKYVFERLIESLIDPQYDEHKRESFVSLLSLLSDDDLDGLMYRVLDLEDDQRKLAQRGLNRIADILYERLEV
jgi:HEAT repeat protein